MRVVDAPSSAPVSAAPHAGPARTATVELLGLVACAAVVAAGLALTYASRTGRLAEDAPAPAGLLQLTTLRSPAEIEPLLTMFETPAERERVARALYVRAVDARTPLQHVGGLSAVTIPAAEIKQDPRLVELRARLARRPGAPDVQVLTSADLAALKPRVAVRTPGEYRGAILRAVLSLLGAFAAAHVIRRIRRRAAEPILLPVLLLLCGIGLGSMIALRDPLRDMVIATGFATGAAAGVAVLLAVSELNLERSRLRRTVLLPLGAAFGLAALLLVFGSGPGTSGAKVNLAGVQPVEAVRLLVILALAAYFARRLEFLRELSEPATRSAPWLRLMRAPRVKDVRPVLVSMLIVLVFFFLQRDLGPALVISCVFLGMYGVARGRWTLVVFGLLLLAAGFAAAYAIGFPATVGQRVRIWTDPWNNGVPGGNQVAHGLWALATGGPFGAGPGLGAPHLIPAGHTDFVLAAVGEELGFAGLAVVLGLYVLLCWRCLRTALRAPGDYSALIAVGVALALVVQALIIAGGLLGLVPLSGVVTPFLSYGKSSMLANFAAVGLVLSIARRQGSPRPHLRAPVRTLGVVLACAAVAVALRALWVQVPYADQYATRSSVGEQADGGYRFEHNPRLTAAARQIPRGSIYDRNGIPIATSRRDEIAAVQEVYRKGGLDPLEGCDADAPRCYPLGGAGFHVLGDLRSQANWGARNSSYVERDRAARLQGFDDRARVVDVVHPKTGASERAIGREYGELLPLVRARFRPFSPARTALLARGRDIRTSIHAGLQLKAAAALRRRIQAREHLYGSAVVLEVDTGEVLAAVSYPWPTPDDLSGRAARSDDDAGDRFLDRARYGLYPPGSIFKLVVAAATLRANVETTFTCARLPDGRVGNYIRGSRRPVRDDLLDTAPHGQVNLHKGLVVSCNAYFAQLAQRLGPRPLLDAASPFQIDAARVPTPAGLGPTLPHAGYGQGEVLVSPMKMARVAAAIAAGGVVRPVSWEAAPGDEVPSGDRFLNAADAELLARHMRDVVTAGTGRALASSRTPIAGKTGTAEVGTGRSHSWFVGFAPYGGARRIAFAVLIENAGYGGGTAAALAGELVDAARDAGLFR